MACLPCRCSSRPSLSPAYLGTESANRPHKLALIEASPDHKLTLLDWNAELSACRDNLNRKLSISSASISHLYQILGLFFVFEGVIISAVAQDKGIACRHSWIIIVLSIITLVATLCACIQKLKEFAGAEKNYLEEQARCSALNTSIQKLKEEGPDFDIVKGQPSNKECSSNSCGFRRFWKAWVWSYAGAVFAVVLTFGGFTLAAVRLILCDT